MLRNYLTIAWRNLRKHKLYTAINVVGLAIGIAACVVITLFVFMKGVLTGCTRKYLPSQ